MRIVLVDPSRIGLKLMTKMLVEGGHEVCPFGNGRDALAALRERAEEIDVLLTSFEIPDVSGLELCWEARLIANAGHPLHVIAMSSNHDRERLIEALDSGADDFITKPPVATELYARLRAAERLNHAQRELIRLADHDALTGLPNRRAFFERAETVLRRHPAGRPLSVICIDIDHFKEVNDHWGHDVGDVVLKAVGDVLATADGPAGRVGGEEFCVLLEGRPLREAHDEAERLRLAIEALRVTAGDDVVSVTASFGVAEQRVGESFEDFLKSGDVALYRAKSGGRNRIIVAAERAPEPPVPVACDRPSPQLSIAC
jgi:diguanylate cyclase (GGDEF)-like protein